MRPILYAVFMLSGAAGLMYEMIWSRYLALFLGHSAYAQVLVIAIFLGGMALGALFAGKRSGRWLDPLKWYAGIELLIGALGIFFHDIFEAATGLAYTSVFPALAGTLLLPTFKWALAICLILPQSILLGATFPLMAAGIMRRVGEQPGRTLSFLYFTNSFGAAVGVLVAGFYIVALAGLPGTLMTAAIINLLVALISWLVATRYEAATVLRVETTGAETSAAPGGTFLPREWLLRVLLAVSFGTAVASFAYEVGWLRMLALVLGSATHSFELMLSAFILGLALGAFWVRRRADRWRRPLRALGAVQLAMGLAALSTLPLYIASFHWTADLLATFARSDSGYVGFTLARYGICLAIMLPSSFCAGMTLPLITRALLVAGAGESSIGQVYGINTLGSIVGVAAAGFVLMPVIGLKGLIVGGAVLDMGLGVWVLFLDAGRRVSARRFAYGAAALTALAAALGAFSRDFDPALLTSGVFRHGRIAPSENRETLFYDDGRTATVAVKRDTASGLLIISTNGKPDGSLTSDWLAGCDAVTERRPLVGDASTQMLAPLITLAHKPNARSAGVIGQGTGMSSHFLLGSPNLEELVTVEIEPEMIRGSRSFYPANHRVFDDERSRIVIDDAKSYFASQGVKYDLILSEPSNPWVSGISSLFGIEFYRRIKDHLAADGVFGQWIHLYEIDNGLVLSILAAIHQNFRTYEIFMTQASDMLVVASDAEALSPPDWSIFQWPVIRQDLCHTRQLTPAALEAMRLTHRRALAPLLDGWAHPNSDYYPIVDLSGERARYLGRTANGFLSMPVEFFDFTAPFFQRRTLPGVNYPPPTPEISRLEVLALRDLLTNLRASGAPENVEELAPSAAAALHRWTQWRALLESDQSPPDWRSWLGNFRAVERDLHTGTAGYADAEFYEAVFNYLDRQQAPAEVRDVVSFYYGLAAWDFSQAAGAARELLASQAHQKGHLPGRQLMEGSAAAFILTGDLNAAGESLAQLRELGGSAGGFRSALLTAYLAAARPRP